MSQGERARRPSSIISPEFSRLKKKKKKDRISKRKFFNFFFVRNFTLYSRIVCRKSQSLRWRQFNWSIDLWIDNELWNLWKLSRREKCERNISSYFYAHQWLLLFAAIINKISIRKINSTYRIISINDITMIFFFSYQ